MRIIFQLSSLFFPLFLFAYVSLYDLSPENFDITTTKHTYKLTLKNQSPISYFDIEGFKFFIPIFTKEFSLKVLRYNSIGFINGNLFMKYPYKLLYSASPTNLEYYLTDYKRGYKQLNYLLNGYAIPYNKFTYLSIEAYNIPIKKSLKLNKYIYFQKAPLNNNKLKYILYSFYLVLNKDAVDYYIKKHYPNSKNYIKKFLQVTTSIKVKKTKKITKKEPKIFFHIRRLLYMKSFGAEFNKNDSNITFLKQNIINSLQNLQLLLSEKLSGGIIFKPERIFGEIFPKIDKLIQKLYTTNLNNCIFNPNNIKKECFNNKSYFQNYTTYLLSQDKIPSESEIAQFGGYKTLNDIGKYFFERGEVDKALNYLKEAYKQNPNPIIAHNLGVLYATPSKYYIPKIAIKYFKKSNFPSDYYNLGVFYYIGKGTKKNYKKAREYFEKSNIPFAKDNLTIMDRFNQGK